MMKTFNFIGMSDGSFYSLGLSLPERICCVGGTSPGHHAVIGQMYEFYISQILTRSRIDYYNIDDISLLNCIINVADEFCIFIFYSELMPLYVSVKPYCFTTFTL